MFEEALEKIKKRKDLSEKEAGEVFAEIMTGAVETPMIAEFLLALKEKKETVGEITAAARIMKRFATKINARKEKLLDTCGTGGDECDTFNVSTISAFVASGAGCSVAKHGNRAVSSRCGSADLLEALGVNIDVPPETVARCIEKIGIGFLFAPKLHLAMKYAMPARKMIQTRSIFNILGPLTNPAGARFHLLGVYERALVETVANVLKNLGSERALVVHGMDGLDEITTTDETYVAELENGMVRTYTVAPEDFGLRRVRKSDLRGGDRDVNAETAMEVLSGRESPRKDIVMLNAGAAIYVTGLADTIKGGIARAEESVKSGRALRKLEDLKKMTL